MLNYRHRSLRDYVFVAWVAGVLALALVGLLVQANDEPTVRIVHWTNGHLLRDDSGLRLLRQMAQEFNDAGHRTSDGTRIEVDVRYAGSAEQAAELLSRGLHGVALDRDLPDPTLVTPSAAHWLVPVNEQYGSTLVEVGGAPSIARALIGIVTYREMAECLGWPESPVGYADVIALRQDPDGWASYDCAQPEWGRRPLVAFTDPTTSSTGRSVLLSLYAIAAGKEPSGLTLADVRDPSVEAYVREFQTLVDHYVVGTIPLNTRIHQGPRYGHFFIMPEDNLVHLYEGTEKAVINGIEEVAPPITESMVMIYPAEGTIARNNCACLVRGEWVTAEQREAADQWVAFLLEDDQQRSFMAAGFRPGSDLEVADPIGGRYGLTPSPDVPIYRADRIDPNVAAAIDAAWVDVKKPGIVTFVVDTSGSMHGEKLDQARDGILSALGSMARTNQVGLVSFASEVTPLVETGALDANRFEMSDAVRALRAKGETALYDAIVQGIEMTDRAEGAEDAIRGVVVLTDGLSNRGRSRLDDIVELASRNEQAVSMSGIPGQRGLDSRGASVPPSDVHAIGLALHTDHPVQIFFIGIGDDADLQIGRLLSEGTGADFTGVAERDLAEVIEEFSRYF